MTHGLNNNSSELAADMRHLAYRKLEQEQGDRQPAKRSTSSLWGLIAGTPSGDSKPEAE